MEAVLANLGTIDQFGGHAVPIWRQCGANLVPIRHSGVMWCQFGTNSVPIGYHVNEYSTNRPAIVPDGG